MGERNYSKNRKNHSRVNAANRSNYSSIQKSRKSTDRKVEVTCIKCRFTKEWTQKMWNTHQWKVHNIRNEIHIGAEKDKPTLFHLYP